MALVAESPPRTAVPKARARRATARRRVIADRLAVWVVSAGGIGIILSIIGILAFILVEVVPLTAAARVEPAPSLRLPAPALAVLTDEYQSHIVALGTDGVLYALRSEDGSELWRRPLSTAAAPVAPGVPVGSGGATPVAPGMTLERAFATSDGKTLVAATADGRVLVIPVEFAVRYDGDQRVIEPAAGEPLAFPLDPGGQPLRAFAASRAPDGTATAAATLAGGELAVVIREARQNMITGEVSERLAELRPDAPAPPVALAIDRTGGNLYAGLADGRLLWWELSAEGVRPRGVTDTPDAAAVTRLGLLLGDRSLLVGRADGSVEVWFGVRPGGAIEADTELRRIRSFPALGGAVIDFAPTQRNKGFLALAEGGHAGLYHSTSERTLWAGRVAKEEAIAALLAPRGDGAWLVGGDQLGRLVVENPHPEVTWKSLFGKVWYEGYDEPAHVWQSTGATDEFEPKLGLTPLLVGTLKGTVYSLLLAIPLGVLGAMYTSQFLHPFYQRYVKPSVEIMAALPTVVLGFLAGLWLAPQVEKSFPALLLMVVVLPVVVLVVGAAWQRLPRGFRGRFPSGIEALVFVPALALAIWGCLRLSVPVEAALFGGNFQGWLREVTGLTYDQRNAVVVGLAMGFAVIPIIFAIAEDAFSNVPRNLVSGSLALGANRWQTVTRVVLPTASPGIFSAIMIGFGRAVGETMIVLMATGNTPIMEWSPFNGFRTLSANIAVEIPEAPVDGTLYRTLFLAALLLFALTFAVNTVAELVRQRLRRRYAQL